MNTNLTQPDVTPIGEKTYKLRGDYTVDFTHPRNSRKYIITVDDGFEYDGATVFPVFAAITRGRINRDGLNRAAALVHDWLYRKKGIVTSTDDTGAKVILHLTRKDIDLIFKEHLERSGIDEKTVKQHFNFVRMFAWVVW
jgi:hypothetical protein